MIKGAPQIGGGKTLLGKLAPHLTSHTKVGAGNIQNLNLE